MGIQNKYLLDPLFQGDDKRANLSFPRRWESSITISWIPFFKGMTKESYSHDSLSFPRRWESRINISWIPFFKGMTRESYSPSLTISWIPFFKGMTRGKSVIPTKVGIQYYHFLDPLFQGDDKRESFPRRWESSITFS
ncbi:MAG: hypothetical protein SFT68_02265, partial [Rickettsiaceae bacterium]|nr:hypothetical protein [Rickettsiaceae bacterium]